MTSVSVVITCHNEGGFVRESLESALSQTAADRIGEVLVIDDGSDEATRDVLRGLPALDPRVRVELQEAQGVAVARNQAVARASGEWIAILDGDDYWLPEKLAEQLPVADRADEDVALIYSDYFVFDEPPRNGGRELKLIRCRPYQPDTEAALEKFFVHDAPFIPSTVLIRRSAFERLGGFDPSYKREEAEMWLRLLVEYRVAHVPVPVAVRRLRQGSLGTRGDAMYASFVRQTEELVARVPRLGPLARKRMARRQTKFAHWLADAGRRPEAARYYARSIRNDPSYLAPYLHLALLSLPQSARGRSVERLRHLAATGRRRAPRSLSWRI